jgi:hypothetical protein
MMYSHISDSMNDMLEGLRGPSWVEQYKLEGQQLPLAQQKRQQQLKQQQEQKKKKKKKKKQKTGKKEKKINYTQKYLCVLIVIVAYEGLTRLAKT